MDRPAETSDTQLIQRLKEGDKVAANELIERFFPRVVQAAERRLKNRRPHMTAADDIAASVFESIWRRASHGGFGDEDLQSSDGFWRLLCKMISFKTTDHLRRESAQKRGGGRTQGESALGDQENGYPTGINEVPEPRLNAAELAILQEEHGRLMGLLDDHVQIQIAVMRLECYSIGDIANHFQKSERWVRRKLELIRTIWETAMDSSDL